MTNEFCTTLVNDFIANINVKAQTYRKQNRESTKGYSR